jgi:glyoxylase-like metal-dependent hydrolase (beta-lactamase superfamily II)
MLFFYRLSILLFTYSLEIFVSDLPIPIVQGFFDADTWTITYVVYEQEGSSCAIIDSVLNYDPKSGRTSTESADKVIEFVRNKKLTVQWILETHAHADHLTAAPYLKSHLGGKTAVGEKITVVQKVFKEIFNLESEFMPTGQQFDKLLADKESIDIGKLKLTAISVPGHTPACMAYQVGDAVFVGDILFMPDVGSARCDFPGGSAKLLYESARKILSMANTTRLFMCHDYPPDSRNVCFETTVAEQREKNIHLHDGVDVATFIQLRTERDKTLTMPVLILPSVQVNIRAGQLPPQESNGIAYLKIPLNAL